MHSQDAKSFHQKLSALLDEYSDIAFDTNAGGYIDEALAETKEQIERLENSEHDFEGVKIFPREKLSSRELGITTGRQI